MKNKFIIIRYGELFLKGKNRNDFVQKLVANITLTFQKNNFSNFNIKKLSDQLIVTNQNDKELPKMISSLNKVFGISVFYLSYQLENDCEKLYDFVREITNHYEINFTTFKFDISRNDKTFSKNSLILQKELGEIIVKSHGLKVNLSSPQTTFYIRIYRNFILFFTEKIKGQGGLPIGSSGKALLLLSGGIDSPVAAYQLMKRGLEVVYCHFYQQKEGQEKIFALAEKLCPYNNYSNNIYLVDTQPLFTEISHISQAKYRLVILKRMFIRLACSLAQELEIKAIATGDSLSQVSSQTLESLTVIQQVSSLIILQPLISWDKKEIIDQAQQIGTYNLSLSKYEDCCSLFEPKHPITKPKKEIVEKLEGEIFWEETLDIILQKMENFS
ncbi:tRNA uracil 4-sulfurtransferase ThiI [endosymbiont GvMRE of Glomus versiforme]|uniref:tRNA uracil 4-sulfurtransferase ThiI n=1 Tax=endosymbiont GvMRE of Glomus versiforme TaxID=2039283 RepID=UPI000EB91F32|nr:tRNA uracil 4-sulfurtransferase ThiI [endosymbiont GvMRE of Glomus versiforme]RHZ35455.1 tRNA sulfurtransferase [endosymbiont GvMRE of Glomus versiforme]